MQMNTTHKNNLPRRKKGKGKLGAYAMKHVAAGAHLPTSDFWACGTPRRYSRLLPGEILSSTTTLVLEHSAKFGWNRPCTLGNDFVTCERTNERTAGRIMAPLYVVITGRQPDNVASEYVPEYILEIINTASKIRPLYLRRRQKPPKLFIMYLDTQ